jgi:hypothetical protein
MRTGTLRDEVWSIFHPDPEDESFGREISHPRLVKYHKLDTTYLDATEVEGSPDHRHTRHSSNSDVEVHNLERNNYVSLALFQSGLRLLGDSIVEYDKAEPRSGNLRYYPAIILTFWSGFEAFVRYYSELMLLTTRGIPDTVQSFLREQEPTVDDKGLLITKQKNQPILKRYLVLLRWGHNFVVNRGDTYWQNLEKANELRDYYTHVGMTQVRAIKSSEIIEYLENVLLAIVVPSCKLQRTLFLGFMICIGLGPS